MTTSREEKNWWKVVWCKQTRGQALLETVVAIPVVLVLLFGCILIGSYLYNKAVIFLAANRGIDAGIGYLYDATKDFEEIEQKMQETAENMSKQCLFVSRQPQVNTSVLQSEDNTEILLSVTVEQSMDVVLPVSEEIGKKLSTMNATAEVVFYKGSVN